MELSPFALFACAVVTLKLTYTGCGLMRIGTMFSCQEWRRQRKKVCCFREGDRTVAAERAVGPEMRTSKREKLSRTECRMEMGLGWVAVLSCVGWGERDSGTERSCVGWGERGSGTERCCVGWGERGSGTVRSFSAGE